jgi:hypothetical protein
MAMTFLRRASPSGSCGGATSPRPSRTTV